MQAICGIVNDSLVRGQAQPASRTSVSPTQKVAKLPATSTFDGSVSLQKRQISKLS